MLEICGHHVFNIIWAHGMSKDHLGSDTNHFRKVFAKVMTDPSVEVSVIVGVDDVCGPCKYKVDGKCESYDGTVTDRKVIEHLGLQEGEVKTWRDLVMLVKDRVKGEEDFIKIFGQGTLESRYSYFRDGMEKLSARSSNEGKREL